MARDCMRADGQAQRVHAIIQRGFPDRFVPLHPGSSPDVIHQDVETALFAIDAIDESAHLLRNETIHLDWDPAAAGFIDERGSLFDPLRPVISDRSRSVVRPVKYTVAPAAPN
jgi:hypothetical protein